MPLQSKFYQLYLWLPVLGTEAKGDTFHLSCKCNKVYIAMCVEAQNDKKIFLYSVWKLCMNMIFY